MKQIEIVTHCSDETMKIAHDLINKLPLGLTITLTGDLGAGKTTFVRGVAKGLEIDDVVQSPTFNIMKIYLKGKRPLIHIDAYRLADIDTEIGLDEYIGYETGYTVIEWPIYIENLIPVNRLEVEIINHGQNERKLTFKTDDESLFEVIKACL